MIDKPILCVDHDEVLTQALDYYEIRWRKKSFDNNHVHITLDIGIKSKPELAKKLKGFTTPKIFKEFPWLRSRLFRGHGFWNPATDGRSGDMEFYDKYLDKQKYAATNQARLTAFL